MGKESEITRRDFLKSTALTSAALVISPIIHGKTMDIISSNYNVDEVPAGELLNGVSDIHIHAMPDSSERLSDEYSIAVAAFKAGYKSVMFKSNDFSCHDRAYIINKALPGFNVFGSLCMNSVHGNQVNVSAAEKAVKTSGGLCRCIWMPTSDAAYPKKVMGSKEHGIPVLDDSGHVLPEVVKVMEICAGANIMFATGHSSPEESIVMAQKAKEIGLEKFVVTHANSMMWKMTHDQIRECIDLGAYIEYCYLPCLWGEGTGLSGFPRMDSEEFSGFIRLTPQRSFITTDLGQVGMPHPLDGMRSCISQLISMGVSERDINLMVRTNPAFLVGAN